MTSWNRVEPTRGDDEGRFGYQTWRRSEPRERSESSEMISVIFRLWPEGEGASGDLIGLDADVITLNGRHPG